MAPGFHVNLGQSASLWMYVLAIILAYPRRNLALTTLGELELVNAFGTRVLRKELTAAQAKSSLSDF
jgi:hypothetical protein